MQTNPAVEQKISAAILNFGVSQVPMRVSMGTVEKCTPIRGLSLAVRDTPRVTLPQ